MVVFHLHNEHAKVNGEPRKGMYNTLAECCAGGVRIMAGDLNMGFWGFIDEMAARGVEVRLIANHGEWNIYKDVWQWDSLGIWVSGPMPKPGKSLTMMAHSRYGMMHPYMLDGKTDIRGYPSSAYCISKYNVPLLDEVVNEAQLRELANWIRDHMDVYPKNAALAAHLPELVPQSAVHALQGRFEMDFSNPDKTQHEIASVPWRNPPPGRTFEMTQHLPPAPQCVEIMSNSILWDPFGQQWGRNGHWPLLVTYGTKRFRSEGMQERRAVAAEAREEAKRTRAAEERYSGNAALAAQAPEEAPDTGGASSSQGIPAALLPNAQARRCWEQAKLVGHT